MRLKRGNHFDRSLASVLLNDPQYIYEMLKHGEHDQPQEIVDEAARLIAEFDASPFQEQCQGESCRNTATRVVLYGDNPDLQWWCSACDPYPYGATPGKVHEVRTYRDAVEHVSLYQDRGYGRPEREEYAFLLSAMAGAKGLNL